MTRFLLNKNSLSKVIVSFSFFILSACATYQGKVIKSRDLLKQGKTAEALVELEKLAAEKSDDQLVYVLDYAMALHIAGQYKESIQAFLQADRLTEVNDYHSASNIVAATLGSEDQIQYKGDSFEKVLINAYLALNYLMLDQYDDALVECRRINEKLIKFKADNKQNYELNPFAKYLSALIWESDHKYDDAYIAFEESYQLDATNSFIADDLVRAAKNAKRDESYKKWKKEFTSVKEDPKANDKSYGELVFIYEQGWGPEKHIRPENHRFPILYPSYSETAGAKITIQGTLGNGKKMAYDLADKGLTLNTEKVYDVEKVAIKTLNDDYGWLVARRLGAQVAKAAAADQLRRKNELLGGLAWVAMNISDRADLRQWSTLPRTIQMARTYLKGGTYILTAQGLNVSGSVTNDQMSEKTIKIIPGRKTFITWRSLR